MSCNDCNDYLCTLPHPTSITHLLLLSLTTHIPVHNVPHEAKQNKAKVKRRTERGPQTAKGGMKLKKKTEEMQNRKYLQNSMTASNQNI